MGSKKNIIFLVPDGVGVRNYLFSNVISELKDKAHIHFWTTLTQKAIGDIKKRHGIPIEYYRFQLPIEPIKVRFFREAATYARLLVNRKKLRNPAVMEYWHKSPSSFKLKLFYRMAKLWGSWASLKYARILSLEKKSKAAWLEKTIEHYKSLLEKINPDTIFITHQRVASLNPICMAAHQLGIKIVTCIYSWDNTAKASLAIKADEYLIWSQYMKDELLQLYPEIPEDTLRLTGTPQFEFYKQQNRYTTKEEMATVYGLDPSKKWICFSGDDERTSPFDPMYLNDVAQAVQTLPENIRPQIVFRRCPVDFSPRYDAVLEQWKDSIVSIDPIWNTSKTNWGGIYPRGEDIDLLVNLVRHCETVINIGSTMAHDFAMMDKPACYIAYDAYPQGNWSTKVIYQFQHFRSMDELDAVCWLKSKEAIAPILKAILENPNGLAPDRKKWLQRIVKHPVEDASGAIAQVLLA